MTAAAPQGTGLGAQIAGMLLQAFGADHNPRLRRAAQAATVGTVGWQLVKQAKARRVAARDFVITVSETDPVYPDLHGWLLEQMPAEDRRSLAVTTVRAGQPNPQIYDPAATPEPRRLRLLFDGRKVAVITVAGHRVIAQIEQVHPGGDDDGEKLMLRRPAKLIFNASSIAGRDAILQVISGLAAKADERGPRLLMARYDYWTERKDIPERSLDTVILRSGQREEIVADLERFLNSEAVYARLGLPWHRGYVFHGPPGTGKSSLARALASHFRLDVHFASLSDCKTDTSLLNLIGSVTPRSMLLLEDVDVLNAATSRDDTTGQGGLSALLNALDGMATPHGLITVMTTNRLDALDPALLRPGRADRVDEIGCLDRDQAARLAALICGKPVAMPRYVKAGLTAAEVMEAAKPWLGQPDGLESAVFEAVRCHATEENAIRSGHLAA